MAVISLGAVRRAARPRPPLGARVTSTAPALAPKLAVALTEDGKHGAMKPEATGSVRVGAAAAAAPARALGGVSLMRGAPRGGARTLVWGGWGARGWLDDARGGRL